MINEVMWPPLLRNDHEHLMHLRWKTVLVPMYGDKLPAWKTVLVQYERIICLLEDCLSSNNEDKLPAWKTVLFNIWGCCLPGRLS
ncbi:hypothetical protein AVEN_203746-1 [Araneus ventricosus]|uniref:Uncharacterized protein n=1 Tax=Araneus ventricosus TaxID=182803 RepID=A0A4Y2GFB2_ARAVE|nr:hypothetical protein AVEN_203746-1 [Araneus ventricosus]